MSLSIALMSRRTSLGAGDIHTDESVVCTAARHDSGYFKELGGLELLNDVLKFGLLNQGCQLVEALGTRLHLLDRVLRSIQIGKNKG